MTFFRSTLVATAFACTWAAASPAMAATESFASVYGLSMTVTGLPGSFVAGQPSVNLYTEIADFANNVLVEQTRITPSSDPINVVAPNSSATAQIGGDDFDTAFFTVQGKSSSDNRYSAVAYATMSFTLAAHSSIIFGATSSVSASFDSMVGESGYAGTYFEIRDDLPGTPVASDSLNAPSGGRKTWLSTSYSNDTDNTITKMLVVAAFVQGESTPVSAVPEPETYAMLLAGLGLMGAVARRRKQAANA